MASNAGVVLAAPSSFAARWRRSGFRAARISFAPSARARRAVSSPMPALPPITTTVCPSSSGSCCRVAALVVVLIISPIGGLQKRLLKSSGATEVLSSLFPPRRGMVNSRHSVPACSATM